MYCLPVTGLVANGESLLGDCYARAGRNQDAEPLLVSSYNALKEVLGPEHVKTVEAES